MAHKIIELKERILHIFPDKNKRILKQILRIFSDWIIFTLGMGILPLLLKLLAYKSFGQTCSFMEFHLELFFMTIVLLADSAKNFSLDSVIGKIALFILLLASGSYAFSLLYYLGFTKFELSAQNAMQNTLIFLGAGAVLDVASLIRLCRREEE